MPELDPASAEARFSRLALLPMRTVGAVGGMSPRAVVASVKDIFAHREMLDLLVKRDLKARYKDSALGFLWALVRPLVQLGIYFVVLGQFLQAARGIPDFAIYVFTGLTAMGLFQEIVVGGTGSVLANAGLVKKVYMPRELFPLASLGSALFNFAIQLIVLILATVVMWRIPLHFGMIYLIPSLLLILVYGLAFAMLFGAINVYLRDTQYLVEVGTLLIFWASPVVYSYQMVLNLVTHPILLEAYTNNPLTLAILGFQRSFWLSGDSLVYPSHLMVRIAIAGVIGVALLFVSHRVFLRMQGNFAQEL